MLILLLIVALSSPVGAASAGVSAAPANPPVAPTAGPPPGGHLAGKANSAPEARTIEMHVGIPGLAYIGQPLKDFLARFPDAKVTAFANQKDAFVIQVPNDGISAYAVGATSEELKLASVGFVLAQPYQGVSPGNFKTSKGIGKGSTVNDLLEAYGQPTQIGGEGPRHPPLSRQTKPGDPDASKKYQYTSQEGGVTTYFVVQANMVARIVVNHLAPLDRYVIKRRPGEPPPAPGAPPPGP